MKLKKIDLEKVLKNKNKNKKIILILEKNKELIWKEIKEIEEGNLIFTDDTVLMLDTLGAQILEDGVWNKIRITEKIFVVS